MGQRLFKMGGIGEIIEAEQMGRASDLEDMGYIECDLKTGEPLHVPEVEADNEKLQAELSEALEANKELKAENKELKKALKKATK